MIHPSPQKKGEFGYEHWTDLTAKRKREPGAKEDPMGGIMDLMKDMYEKGDDNMKKLIGESMVSTACLYSPHISLDRT